MPTAEHERRPEFAIWLTGLPGSGKSTIAAALRTALTERSIGVEVLESDVLSQVLMPRSLDSEKERERFYGQMVWIGELLVRHGVAVIFDATANLRSYRDAARDAIPRFIEVYVECPLDVCLERDQKGIYQRGQAGFALYVPGLQAEYQPPDNPELTLWGDREEPSEAARRVIELLEERDYLASR